jgi:acyl carrier protein
MSATADKIRAILASQLDIDPDKINDTTDIAEDLGADSLDVVELMMSVEEEFEITIDEDAVKDFRTIADVASYIDDNL